MEADQCFVTKAVVTLVVGGTLWLCMLAYYALLLKPRSLASRLHRQGIRGPAPSLLLGNIPDIKSIQLRVKNEANNQKENLQLETAIDHDWPSRVFPHLQQWIVEYGPTFLYSTGNIQQLLTIDTEILKEINQCTSRVLGKPSYLREDRGPLLGNSVLSTGGSVWAHQRKIIAPEFFMDKVKGMMSLMADCTKSLVKSWESVIESERGTAVIDIDSDMRRLSADIISRACFGSNYAKGEEIFLKLRTLQDVMSKGYIGIPGLRHFPTKQNREIWRLEKEIKNLILMVIKQRAEANHEKDLLQVILEAAKGDNEGLLSSVNLDEFIVDNCKGIYFAGHETTAISASWSLMLLAAHPDWQARARAEVLEICKDKLPDFNMLRNLKVLTMVIQETLRLYPPGAFVSRSALEDIKFKDLIVPKGMNIQIPVSIVQQNPDLWGPDAHQFNPERFANGVLGACKTPQAYMPFGLGSHICLGQHLATVELKIILSCMLTKFSFSLSPTYHHSPILGMVIYPQRGVNLCVRRVS